MSTFPRAFETEPSRFHLPNTRLVVNGLRLRQWVRSRRWLLRERCNQCARTAKGQKDQHHPPRFLPQ
jgi:hypothetical protein